MRGKRREIIDGKLLCPVCGEWKHIECFSRHVHQAFGRGSYCKECQNRLYREKYNKNTIERRKSGAPRIKSNARWLLNYHVRVGNIEKPGSCSLLGIGCLSEAKGIQNPKLQAHHFDHRRAKDVLWLCFECHNEYESKLASPDLIEIVNRLIMEKYPDVTEDEILRCRTDAALSYVQLSGV